MNKLLAILLLLSAVRPLAGQDAPKTHIFPLGAAADSLYRQGYYNAVLPFAFNALQAIRDTTSVACAKAAFRLGELEYLAGRFAASETHLRQGLRLYDRQKKAVDDTTAYLCNALILTLIQNTKWREADSLLESLLARAE